MGQMRVRRTGPWVKISCPFSWAQFIPRVGHGVGQAVDPHFDPYLKVHFCNEKHPKSEDFRCFLELLTRFELVTSSLPITTFTFCSVSHRLQSLINQGFLCRIFCFGSSLGVTFHSVSPQIHPKPAYAAFGRSFFVPNFSIENRYFLTKQRKILP